MAQLGCACQAGYATEVAPPALPRLSPSSRSRIQDPASFEEAAAQVGLPCPLGQVAWICSAGCVGLTRVGVCLLAFANTKGGRAPPVLVTGRGPFTLSSFGRGGPSALALLAFQSTLRVSGFSFASSLRHLSWPGCTMAFGTFFTFLPLLEPLASLAGRETP